MPPQRYPLVWCRLTGPAIAVAMSAQAVGELPSEPTDGAADPSRRQVITGTRFTEAELQGDLSVTTLDLLAPSSISRSSVVDRLRVSLPALGGPGNYNDGIANGGDGSQGISLRGLPADATLVLVNGRRTSTGDLALIPDAAIERIEVLNDGAGAIYGADAVAGVVNVILRERFDGLEMSAGYLNTFDTDISQRTYRAVWGFTRQGTSLLMTGEYLKSNSLQSRDRSRSRPQPGEVSPASNPGTFSPVIEAGTHTVDGAAVPDALPLRWSLVPGNTTGLTRSTQLPAGFNPYAVADTRGARTFEEASSRRDALEDGLNRALPAGSPVRYGPSPSLVEGLDPGFPFGLYTTAYRPREANGASLIASHRVFDHHLSVFATAYYKRHESRLVSAPAPLPTLTLPVENYWVRSVLGPSHPAAPPLDYTYRTVELGPRTESYNWDAFHTVLGLKGDIADSSWSWEVAHLWDRVTLDDYQAGGVLASEWERRLGLSTPDAWNPFGYTPIGGVASVNTEEALGALHGTARSRFTYVTHGVDGHARGTLHELPGGPVQALVGIDAFEVSDLTRPDPALQEGMILPFNTLQPLDARRGTIAGFSEITVPVLGQRFRIPGGEALDFRAAVRHENYSDRGAGAGGADIGSSGFKPRFSVRWAPIPRQCTVHASYAQGFTVPGFSELYSRPEQDYQELFNPLTGHRIQPENGVLTMGNTHLKPSTAETFLGGATITPDFWSHFAIGIQYYRIEQADIPFESAQYFIQQWWAAGGPARADNPFGPDATPSPANPLGTRVTLTPEGEFDEIRNVGPINSGRRITDGLDFTASKSFPTDAGTLQLTGRATRMLGFRQEDFPGGGRIDYLGRYWASGAALPDTGFPAWRAGVDADFSRGAFGMTLSWNLTQGYLEDPSGNNFLDPDGPVRRVSDYHTFDLAVRYTIPRLRVDVTLGILNCFDERPPLVLSSLEGNYDRRLADLRGRMGYVALARRF